MTMVYGRNGFQGARGFSFGSFGSGMTPMIRLIVMGTAAVFLLQMLMGGRWVDYLSLSTVGLRHGMLWQPLTYMFLHANLGHLFMNMLGLVFLGQAVERGLGSRAFLALYFLSGILGGIGYVLIDQSLYPCVGASGAVFGVLAAFATMYPHQPVAFIFLPFVTFKAWVLVLGYMAIELMYLIQGGAGGGGIAHSAHFAGGLAGYVFVRVLTDRGGFSPFRGKLRRVPRQPEPPSWSDADERAVDALLDKIARQGLMSLTPAERLRLEEAAQRRGR
jgi:membrane associated rhomboid family serine protease